MPRKKYDIRTASLTQFRDFVFDHEVRDAKNVPWYQDENLVIAFDPAHNAIRFSEMFQNARSLLRKYDSATLEQGYWAMFGRRFRGKPPRSHLEQGNRTEPEGDDDQIHVLSL